MAGKIELGIGLAIIFYLVYLMEHQQLFYLNDGQFIGILIKVGTP